MTISRRIATFLSGLVLLGAVAAGPALASKPSDGYCDPSELGDIALGNDGSLYECVKNPDIGRYVWELY
jgi:hypothetical protein